MQTQYSPELIWLNYVNSQIGVHFILFCSLWKDIVKSKVFKYLPIPERDKIKADTFGLIECCCHPLSWNNLSLLVGFMFDSSVWVSEQLLHSTHREYCHLAGMKTMIQVAMITHCWKLFIWVFFYVSFLILITLFFKLNFVILKFINFCINFDYIATFIYFILLSPNINSC